MTMLQGRFSRADWGVVLWWVIATAAGWLAGFAVCEAFSAFLKSISSDGLIIGTGVGIAQWLVLRRQLPVAGWWILATILGFGIGKLEGDALAQTLAGPVGSALGGAAIGFTVGLAQWVVLRRHVDTAAWWLAISAVAWAVGWLIIGIAAEAGEPAPTSAYAIGTVGAAVAGAITGTGLAWLLRTRALRRP